ncbi:sirohydrochlorin chelatase [Heliorestis convoluta]|uniref:Sirohydrochlorin cobaltochelatase n=1 Tax=Heliorestis convoluta TaxID=356322 RepID=A0A5Q2MWQ6_9FIRM|nr:CbiX/SirB N-terminal domain-containing protein [Heliorestis convoluta]QGG46898.1 Sirohydrochlorin cobaltochelatase [Heliorestis convoluta]
MKSGVILFAHGSRAAEANENAVALGELVKEQFGVEPLLVAFMELAEPSLEEGIRQLIEKEGVDNVKVVPLFLNNGIHLKRDIPCLLEELRPQYPHVTINLGRPFGVDKRLAQLIHDRIQELP